MGWGTYWGTGWGNTSFEDVVAKELSVIFSATGNLSANLVSELTLSTDMTAVGTLTATFADNIQNLSVAFTAIATLFTKIREDDLGPIPIIPLRQLFVPITILPKNSNIILTPKLAVSRKKLN